MFFCCVVVVLHRAYENHFQGSFKKYAEKYCKVAPRNTSSYHKVDWLSSYFHACHDEISYFNRGVFPICYHDMVDAGHFFI